MPDACHRADRPENREPIVHHGSAASPAARSCRPTRRRSMRRAAHLMVFLLGVTWLPTQFPRRCRASDRREFATGNPPTTAPPAPARTQPVHPSPPAASPATGPPAPARAQPAHATTPAAPPSSYAPPPPAPMAPAAPTAAAHGQQPTAPPPHPASPSVAAPSLATARDRQHIAAHCPGNSWQYPTPFFHTERADGVRTRAGCTIGCHRGPDHPAKPSASLRRGDARRTYEQREAPAARAQGNRSQRVPLASSACYDHGHHSEHASGYQQRAPGTARAAVTAQPSSPCSLALQAGATTGGARPAAASTSRQCSSPPPPSAGSSRAPYGASASRAAAHVGHPRAHPSPLADRGRAPRTFVVRANRRAVPPEHPGCGCRAVSGEKRDDQQLPPVPIVPRWRVTTAG